jgi:aminoglycoside 2'-N-acetyltransferase I
VIELRVAHTADLGGELLAASRALLFEVFDDMTEHDWEHSLGGMHAVVLEEGAVAGHTAVIQRRLLHGGQALRAGYVEGVAVRADRRRQGLATAMMTALERIIRSAYDLGALGATDEAVPFYTGRGWQAWPGRCAALTPAGVLPTPDEEGAVFVLPCDVPLEMSGELICDWRDGDVW